VEIRDRLRTRLAEAEVAGIVLTASDNVTYLTGYESVMDGWRLPEPTSAVFVPTSPELPVTLFLPEASLIGLVVAAREGHAITYDQLRTFDLLNFCVTGRAEDVHLALAPDLLAELEQLFCAVDSQCSPNIVHSIASCLRHLGQTGQTILFDDMRIALNVEQDCGQRYADGIDLMLAARSIKTDAEIALFRDSGVKADRVMAFTVAQLGRGRSWAEIEKSVAHFMIDEDIDPLPTSPMLFGGSYDAIFKPDLFRTRFDTPFKGGEIAILETQGRYKNIWIDINRTAHIGKAPAQYREQHAIVQRCFEEVVQNLRPGANSADICEPVRCSTALELDAPGKLLMIVHSIGRVPLESPVRYPSTGLHAATEGFEIEPNMVLSFDSLYFGSKHGPSHMENVFVVGEDRTESIYSYPLELIETD
jgi:Xaa-Pro dipeptidase